MSQVELKYQFRVSESGEIKIVNRKDFTKDMVKYFAGKSVVGTFKKPRKIRSSKQNSFYWAVTVPEVLESLVEAGYERHMLNIDTVHEFLVDKFLKFDLPSSEYAGEFISITKRSKELTTGEWLDYQADIAKWAAEFLNVKLSVPEEQKEINY